ncbi:MAG: NADP-dependent phosphogluconate dehydrogenase, partial [Brevefilum sp.]
MEKAKFGVVGMGVMGQNIALNIANKGFSVAVYNRTDAKTVDFVKGSAKDKPIIGTYSYEGLTEMLERPRKILVMVKAGAPVDYVIEDILPHLEEGDLLIDGGNSFFEDTQRRSESLREKGFLYMGAGISGGEEGALLGPSIMPGGVMEAWEAVEEILRAAAAKADDGEPCVDYMGPGSAGHYVKMVHNGIEYAIMQLIGEVYDLLHRSVKLSYDEMGDLFADWNQGELSSYLVEITAEILKTEDSETGKPILEVILDKAKQKGTGKWTSQNAMDLGAATHTINAAVSSRIISGSKEMRVKASEMINGPDPKFKGDAQQLIGAVKEALYAAVIISYA